MLYKAFTTDPNLERKGVLLHYGYLKDSDGKPRKDKPVNIRIARAGGSNASYLRRAEALLKPHRRQIQTETIDRSVVDDLTRQLYAETVVLGWENVQDKDGVDMPFTVDNCIKLFTDLPDLFTDVQEQAGKAALFLAEVREADSGN